MVSTSNKMSLHMRTGPHDYGPREWGVFFLRLNRRLESLRSISVRVRAGSRPSARCSNGSIRGTWCRGWHL